MSEFFINKELVFQYDERLLFEIIKLLKSNNYINIQYLPTRQSYLAIVKEHENIFNLIFKKKHLLFYYSLFPKFYRFFLSKKIRTYLDACFFNKYITREEMLGLFPEEIINQAISNKILLQKDNKLRFTISFVPFENYIFLRDPHYIYDEIEINPEKSGEAVWMGADSIIFAKIIKKYLNKISYKQAIEIGSGTGVQIIISSQFVKICKAFDNNKRAVQYTKLNASVNKIKNIETFYSDMFENVKGLYDLILVNPWFINLQKGGLEEVPFIMKELKHFLKKDGLCLMLLNSYVKEGRDTAYEYFKNFIKSTQFNLEMHAIGYGVETSRTKDYKKYGVDYYTSYYVVIKMNGQGTIAKYDASPIRRLRDFTFIKIFKIFNKFSKN